MFDAYTHFAIINNGMRGPFVAAGNPSAKQHWASPFIQLLSDDVKLAGNSLSCERGVHLQGPFLLTDRCGHTVDPSEALHSTAQMGCSTAHHLQGCSLWCPPATTTPHTHTAAIAGHQACAGTLLQGGCAADARCAGERRLLGQP